MRVRYSPRASNDLAEIFQYLSGRSPRGAVNMMTGIYAAVEFVRRNPRAAEATAIPGVRAKVVQRYNFKIFYRIIESDDIVEVVHIRHTSRKPWSGEGT
jgi:plasmid stabilization system protein ParE